MTRAPVPVAALALVVLTMTACRDIDQFTTTPGDRYEGAIVDASFVRSGIASGVRLCLSLDVNHLQDSPGVLRTSDGRFRNEPLRPIPQLWHDPISTLSFGDGRLRNLVYVASSMQKDWFVVVSLMSSGDVEVRLLRGAPKVPGADAAPDEEPGFGVFSLRREKGPCSF